MPEYNRASSVHLPWHHSYGYPEERAADKEEVDGETFGGKKRKTQLRNVRPFFLRSVPRWAPLRLVFI